MSLVRHNYSLTQADDVATSIVRPTDWNSSHLQSYTVLGNTTGNSTGSGTNIFYSADGHNTFQASDNTIIFMGARVSNEYAPIQSNQGAIFAALGTGSLHAQFFSPELDVAVNNIVLGISFNRASSTNTRAATHRISYGIFSRNAGNYINISRVSTSYMQTIFSDNSNIAAGVTISRNADASFTTTSAGTVLLNNFVGANFVELPFVFTLKNGVDYAFVIKYASTSAGSSNVMSELSFLNLTWNTNTSWGKFFTNNVTSLSSASYRGTFNNEMLRMTGEITTDNFGLVPASLAFSRARLYINFKD